MRSIDIETLESPALRTPESLRSQTAELFARMYQRDKANEARDRRIGELEDRIATLEAFIDALDVVVVKPRARRGRQGRGVG